MYQNFDKTYDVDDDEEVDEIEYEQSEEYGDEDKNRKPLSDLLEDEDYDPEEDVIVEEGYFPSLLDSL